jgi:transposase
VSNKRIIALLEDQLRLSAEREKSLSEQLHQQSILIEELTASIRSLEEALLLKNDSIQALAGKNRGLGKLLSGKSEKITVISPGGEVTVLKEAAVVNLKERGNNNAKRKEFFDIETIIEEIYPNDPGFDLQKSRVIGYVDPLRVHTSQVY